MFFLVEKSVPAVLLILITSVLRACIIIMPLGCILHASFAVYTIKFTESSDVLNGYFT